MFTERDLSEPVAAVRDAHAPDALVLDCDRDFETLPAPARDELATLAAGVTPHDYERAWLPADAPELLARLVEESFLVGAPGDGAVAWTVQTTPPAVLVKPRVEGSPEGFVEFLVAEALVEAGAGLPEQFLGYFGESYPRFAGALDADPATTYQVAAACCDAYRGLHTRDVFEAWSGDLPTLHDAERDATGRIQARLDGLSREVARGETGFSDAAELACSGVKHGCDLPAPFAALDTLAYRDHGADYAVRWAEKVGPGDADGT